MKLAMSMLKRICRIAATFFVSFAVVAFADVILFWPDIDLHLFKQFHLQNCVLIATALGLTFAGVRWLRSREIPAIALVHAPHEEALASVLKTLRLRARHLMWSSIGFGLLIVCVVAWCLFQFTRADFSASRVSVDRDYYELRERRNYLIELMDETGKRIEKSQDQVERAVLEKRYKELQGQADDLLLGNAPRAQTAEDTRVLVFSITNKVGGVLILLFMVKLLTTLYRYNTRLVAFYHSRADAIQLSSQETAVDLKKLTDLLYPSRIDYVDKIKTPAEDVLDHAKEIIAAARPNAHA